MLTIAAPSWGFTSAAACCHGHFHSGRAGVVHADNADMKEEEMNILTLGNRSAVFGGTAGR